MRQGVCAMCSHNEVIQAAPVEFGQGTRVLSVAHQSGWSGIKSIGLMNIFVCRRCGFVQWFASEPDKIPIGDEFTTRLVRGSDPSGPYR